MKKTTGERAKFLKAVRASFIQENREAALEALASEPHDDYSRQVKQNFLDSAELDAEIRARYPDVLFFSELGGSGIDYSDSVPTLKYWLERTQNENVKVGIAKLLAFPVFDASSNLARVVRDVASNSDLPAGFQRDFNLQVLSQCLIRATNKKDLGLLFEFAADSSLPMGSRIHFIEAMARRKDPRVLDILRDLIPSTRFPAMTLRWLKLFKKFEPDDLRDVASKLTSHPNKDVRDLAAEILDGRSRKVDKRRS